MSIVSVVETGTRTSSEQLELYYDRNLLQRELVHSGEGGVCTLVLTWMA
jgi:hypothetical protein